MLIWAVQFEWCSNRCQLHNGMAEFAPSLPFKASARGAQSAAFSGEALADGWEVPVNVESQWLGHANLQVALRIYMPTAGSATVWRTCPVAASYR